MAEAADTDPKVSFWADKARYHRAMAIACADDEERCAFHSGELRKAIEQLRGIAHAQAEAFPQ